MANESQSASLSAAEALALLEEEKAALSAKLADLGHGDDGGLKYDSNFADTSQVTAERSEAEALATELQETLAEVEAAIARVHAGTYGLCQVCGNPISEARLEAMPAARLCITCASRH